MPSQAAIPIFDDSDPLRTGPPRTRRARCKVAGEGVRLPVSKTDNGGDQLQVKVTFDH